jgi:hypothetical protein
MSLSMEYKACLVLETCEIGTWAESILELEERASLPIVYRADVQ